MSHNMYPIGLGDMMRISTDCCQKVFKDTARDEGSVNGENWPLLEKWSPVEVQGFRKIANCFWGILWNIPYISIEKPEDHSM